MNVLVIGNGPSRIEYCRDKFTRWAGRFDYSIGCNSIWKDFPTLSYFTIVDPAPLREYVNGTTGMLTRLFYPDPVTYTGENTKESAGSCNSGVEATKFAINRLKAKKITFVGMDYFLKEHSMKNVYNRSSSPDDDFVLANRQRYIDVFRANPDVEFVFRAPIKYRTKFDKSALTTGNSSFKVLPVEKVL